MSFYNGLNITQLAMESVDRRVVGDGLELEGNLTLVQVVSEVVQELETQREMTETEYQQFLADVWVGVVLTLMVLSCVCCMCSCLLYHKFQQWKRRVLEQRAAASRDADYRGAGDNESLPSYTLVSGLPSYEEALEQLKQVHALRRGLDHVMIFDRTVDGISSSNNNNNHNKLLQHHLSAMDDTGAGDIVTCSSIEIANIHNNNSLSHSHNYVTQLSCENQMSRLSVADLLQIYKIQQQQQQQQEHQHQQQQQQQHQQQQIGNCSNLHQAIVKI